MTESGATFSVDGTYRYELWRHWDTLSGFLHFVMLNPSTADDATNDNTIRRCIGFAEREGFGGIHVSNLYAMRCTRPVHLLDIPDPEGPDNLRHFMDVRNARQPIVVAWGAYTESRSLPQSNVHRFLLDNADHDDLWCLGTTKGGNPRHPLYLSNDTRLVHWAKGNG